MPRAGAFPASFPSGDGFQRHHRETSRLFARRAREIPGGLRPRLPTVRVHLSPVPLRLGAISVWPRYRFDPRIPRIF